MSGGGESSLQKRSEQHQQLELSFWGWCVCCTALACAHVHDQVTGAASQEHALSSAFVPNSVPGLKEVLSRLAIQSRAKKEVQLWCAQEGAAYLEEVAENAEELCDNVSLTALERSRILAWAKRQRRELKVRFADHEPDYIEYEYIEYDIIGNMHESPMVLDEQEQQEEKDDMECLRRMPSPPRRRPLKRAATTHMSPMRVRWHFQQTLLFEDVAQPAGINSIREIERHMQPTVLEGATTYAQQGSSSPPLTTSIVKKLFQTEKGADDPLCLHVLQPRQHQDEHERSSPCSKKLFQTEEEANHLQCLRSVEAPQPSDDEEEASDASRRRRW